MRTSLRKNLSLLLFAVLSSLIIIVIVTINVRSNGLTYSMISTSPVVENEQLNGAILGFYSVTGEQTGSTMNFRHLKNLQHVNFIERHKVVLNEFWLNVLLIALLGMDAGLILGILLTNDVFRAEADRIILDHTYKMDVTEFNLKSAASENNRFSLSLKERERQLKEREKYLTSYESSLKGREGKIEPAEAANNRANEAERKLEKERADHKEILAKAGRRIEELKKKGAGGKEVP